MEIVVPELGESIVEATVARWLKKEGDRVSVGEPLVELETDKVDLEVGAKQDGVLQEILQPEGADVQVGELLGRLEPVEGGAPEAGREPDQAAPVGEMAGAKAGPGAEMESQEKGEEAPVREKDQEVDGGSPAARPTPVAQRMAREEGIDLGQVPGSGPRDRVTKEDVQRFLDRQKETPQERPATEPPSQPKAKPQPTPAQAAQSGREERVRMSRRRRTIAARLVEAQQTAAILTTFNDVDMSAVIDLRKRRQDAFRERYDIKLGFMSFFVKATVGALKDFPNLNAEIDGDEIVLKKYYDIGIAVGVEDGLVVPVLREADRLSFAEIERSIRDFAERAREGKLTLEELRGGTFSITNGGIFGSLLSTPILNPPEVGILGLHRIEERPVAVEGQVQIRPMMYMALSYDHRIVDGREAVQFLVRIKELIEDPERLLLEGS